MLTLLLTILAVGAIILTFELFIGPQAICSECYRVIRFATWCECCRGLYCPTCTRRDHVSHLDKMEAHRYANK